ncbi:MAG: hypothetical protein HZC41_05990 [Chloroflexi bacterium]|nr:hypothetical protein [Chloroflexota bacterium]
MTQHSALSTRNSELGTRNFPLSPWQVALALAVVYLAVILVANGGDWKTFVTIGDCWSSCVGNRRCPPGTTNGYDGQYAYSIARNPANAAPCLDVPAYRYQRILLPLLGRALAFGNPDWIPAAFVVINLAALAVGVALLEKLLAAQRVSRWYALVYGLFVGIFMSVRLSTTEPLAYGLVIAGIWFGQRGRFGWQALALLAAAFAKEMALTFVAGYLLFYALERCWRRAVWLALAIGVPFALWQLALFGWLGAFGVGSGGGGNSPFEIIPFNGFWRTAYDPTGSLPAFLLLSLFVVPGVIVPAAWGVWAAARDLWRGRRHPYTCLLLVNAALMAFIPFSTYREPLGILRVMAGLVLAHLLYAALRHPRRRPLVYSPLWLALSFYLVAG